MVNYTVEFYRYLSYYTLYVVRGRWCATGEVRRRWMPERERRVGRVDYSEGAQLRLHIDREVMGKVSQSALSTLLKELTNPGGSRKWEDEDCPPWKCPKSTTCNVSDRRPLSLL